MWFVLRENDRTAVALTSGPHTCKGYYIVSHLSSHRTLWENLLWSLHNVSTKFLWSIVDALYWYHSFAARCVRADPHWSSIFYLHNLQWVVPIQLFYLLLCLEPCIMLFHCWPDLHTRQNRHLVSELTRVQKWLFAEGKK